MSNETQAGYTKNEAERARIIKLEEDNERLRYRIRILENAVSQVIKQ